jgi:hypothetical protein
VVNRWSDHRMPTASQPPTARILSLRRPGIGQALKESGMDRAERLACSGRGELPPLTQAFSTVFAPSCVDPRASQAPAHALPS